jgi:hypothetical protein
MRRMRGIEIRGISRGEDDAVVSAAFIGLERLDVALADIRIRVEVEVDGDAGAGGCANAFAQRIEERADLMGKMDGDAETGIQLEAASRGVWPVVELPSHL